ncbi:MAG: hypothetical protein A3I61_16810 [Acidobacteria bacterium RIFCSPLOWO2_02_FULL_68_18]|nr:MAG: hypothetical protein A3I61_16810 [Acidobacteria bacterium RIFCSPLOWO2_02_FULL_68_18]OFW50117.1 MAG: hypothetical protein A3G77_09190 [Acidobacteria bacterium RIFCSPLOWO2_12_FULL_68_19]
MIVPLLAAAPESAFSQCEEYELLIKDGLKAGQSIAVRTFGVGESLSDQRTFLEALQTTLAESVVDSLEGLRRFSAVAALLDSDTSHTDLVMEGVVTRADQGSKVRRAWLPASERAPAEVRVSGVIKRVSDGSSVLWFHCTTRKLGVWQQTGVFTLLFGESGNTLLRSGSEEVAKKVAKTIIKSDRMPVPGKPRTTW